MAKDGKCYLITPSDTGVNLVAIVSKKATQQLPIFLKDKLSEYCTMDGYKIWTVKDKAEIQTLAKAGNAKGRVINNQSPFQNNFEVV